MKRFLFLSVSLGVFLADRFRRGLYRCVGKKPPASAVILFYHSVPPESRAQFGRQMDEIVRHAVPFKADTPAPLPPGACHVAVTFDDGFQNVVDNALPELERRGIPCTIFIVTDALGGLPRWHSYSEAAMEQPIMSADQLLKLRPGLVQIGSHSRTHPVIPFLSDVEMRHELRSSRATLEELLQREVTLFSFPYGEFSEDAVRCCREAGYRRVFTVLPYSAFSRADEYAVGRVEAHPDDSLLEFRLKIAGAYRWLPFAFALKRRLVPGSESHQGQRVASPSGTAGR
jgi:peptidoglycan/xylan/chitin deacetylase (PgdA/CDA1 family)